MRKATYTRSVSAVLAVAFSVSTAFAQQDLPPDTQTDATPSKHVLWIIPNFRTTPMMADYTPISTKEKFEIARQDSFDRGTIALAALFAAQSDLTASNPSFGHGVPAYAHYWAASYADYAIGDYMTEAIYPTLLHQDPRYFRLGYGSHWSRLRHAVGQILVTRTDNGGRQFNYSEFVGNATAVAVSMSYYPENRRASDAVSKLATQVAVDLASNLVKEFWPSKKASRETPIGAGTP